MNITLNELALAFRKAKVDIYYSSHASLLDWANYEEQLTKNLHELLNKLNGHDDSWIKEPNFIGDWNLVPKSVSPPKNSANNPPNNSGIVFAEPKAKWDQLFNFEPENAPWEAEFRLMAQCSVDFHIVSTLWILKVGHKFDNALSQNAYGNRLRRDKNGDFNQLSLGSFKPYLKPFQNYRDNGITKIKEALGPEKNILALSTDIAGFYHNLRASFIGNELFISKFDDKLSLTKDEKKLNRLFVASLEEWAKRTPAKTGIPVGLPASALIANLALSEFDRGIEEQVVPLYYGRYVDDILLVMENGPDVSSLDDLWNWLLVRLEKYGLSKESSKDSIQFQPNYLEGCDIVFSDTKTKVFLLSGETGDTFIASIQRQISQRGSEWRELPSLPDSAASVSTRIVAATQVSGENADNISKVDLVSLGRAGFAMQLRDFEAYERDLAPDDWKEYRHAFFQSIIDHLLVLPKMFELEIYIPRIVRLATSCEDFAFLRKILDRLSALTVSITKNCKVHIKSIHDEALPDESELDSKWHQHIFSSVFQAIATSFPFELSSTGRTSWTKEISPVWEEYFHEQSFEYFDLESISDDSVTIAALQTLHLQLFLFDLAHMPFRFSQLPNELVSKRGTPKSVSSSYKEDDVIIPHQIESGVSILHAWLEEDLSNEKTKINKINGLVYPTRPFSISELYFVSGKMLESDDAEQVVLATRGFTLGKKRPQYIQNGDSQNIKFLDIPKPRNEGKISIAVSSWKCEKRHWSASVKKDVISNFDRYQRLVKLVNDVIKNKTKISYFILPELAIPASWFLRIATKLQKCGISLISGIEYLHANNSIVHHQVWAALTHDGLGFPSMMVYRQDKQRPAFHEEQNLYKVGGLRLSPKNPWIVPPILNHGGFRFSLLVCSELTNIAYRASLRGRIDALFAPEWNQDIESFNSLVESAALDIHAYIIQCNSRDYGDSRIRAPYKAAYKRDILKVKGGTDDFFVNELIDIEELRKFQSHFRSPSNGPFKPVPDGFTIDEGRKLPL